jgi:hypothetical protein
MDDFITNAKMMFMHFASSDPTRVARQQPCAEISGRRP